MQDANFLNEQQLLAEISLLREQFPHTQELYREVCTLLFFRHGITPTTNKLYQLVRKGSMSAPAEALTKFWEDLREKSRVRIEHPDLPETLKTAAGELTAALWAQAQAAAQHTFEALHEQAQARVVTAQSALAAAEARSLGAADTLAQCHDELRAVLAREQALGQQLAASDATRAALLTQLKQAQHDHEAQQHRLTDARREFAVELDKLRSTATLAEQRMVATQKRALLEIDHERSQAARAQKELDASRTRASAAADKAGAGIAALQQQLGDLRQQNGKLEGSLQAVTASRDLLERELASVRDSLAAGEITIAELRQAARLPTPAAPRNKPRNKPHSKPRIKPLITAKKKTDSPTS